jgi:SAM-dependent methyltransferase
VEDTQTPGFDLRTIASNLDLTPEGWWTSRTLSSVAYPEEGNSLCFAVEDSSFWFQHRNGCLVETIARFPPPGVLFDIGGGNGCVARAVQQAGHEVVLVEPGLSGVQNALKRGIRNVVHGTFEDIGALPETIPAAGLFDVIEHIEDDSGFMSKIHRSLIPGGRVYITVPAYGWLWSHEDVMAGHSRRHTVGTLRRLLNDTGFTVDFASYFFGFLPLPVLLFRAAPYRLGLASVSPAKDTSAAQDTVRSDHKPGGRLTSWVLKQLTDRELSRIVRGSPLRWGGSCLAVASKK